MICSALLAARLPATQVRRRATSKWPEAPQIRRSITCITPGLCHSWIVSYVTFAFMSSLILDKAFGIREAIFMIVITSIRCGVFRNKVVNGTLLQCLKRVLSLRSGKDNDVRHVIEVDISVRRSAHFSFPHPNIISFGVYTSHRPILRLWNLSFKVPCRRTIRGVSS